MLVIAVALASVTVRAAPRVWVVDDDGPADFSRIQDAVNAASIGDSVFVKIGVYYEKLSVYKSISIAGEDKYYTIIDAGGLGTAVLIEATSVSFSNFTIRNAGRLWPIFPRPGDPDSNVRVSSVVDVQVTDNILVGAAVGVMVTYSVSIDIGRNVVSGASSGGIIGYGSRNLSITDNLVASCGLLGIHLDAGTIDSKIVNNTMTGNVEGLEVANGSISDRIEANVFRYNSASIVLNSAGGFSVFRNNAMNDSIYSFVVFGYYLENFLQDIDSSNLVNGRKVYYLTSLRDQVVSPETYQNPGFLALVNSTNIVVKNFDIANYEDSMMLAFSADCILTNITIHGNYGPLMWGGLTFYYSYRNIVTYSRVSNNSLGLAFYHSEWNIFHHNYFVDNARHVVIDPVNPFTNRSSGYYSANTWGDGYFGNYWSDYRGLDENYDGVGDTPYTVGVNNVDYYPLFYAQPKLDTTPPQIYILSPAEMNSPGYVISSSTLTIVWEGWDDLSGIAYYEFRLDGSLWDNVGNNTTLTIGGLSDGSHILELRAFDRDGNMGQVTLDFVVNTGANVIQIPPLPPYFFEVVLVTVIGVVAAITVIVIKQKGYTQRRVTRRRLVRQISCERPYFF